MRVLLTGAAGQLGRAMVSHLRAEQLLATDRLSLDLEKPAHIMKCVEAARPQLIINCAAQANVEEAELEQERTHLVNGVAPGLLAEAASRVDAGLIHFSTDYVFDGQLARAYREDDACAPLNAYGRSKLEGEQNIAASQCAHLIIRTSWLYASQGRNFLTTILRLCHERTELQVVADQFGIPTSVDTLCLIVRSIVQSMKGNPVEFLHKHGGILHAACAGRASWHEFAVAIVAHAKAKNPDLRVNTVKPIRSADYHSRVLRPANSCLDTSRLQSEFGIRPVPWRNALKETMSQV